MGKTQPGLDLRILYTDLDGTLLGPGGSLFASASGSTTSRAPLAVARLHEAGIALALVSGRTRDQVREIARVLGARSYICELGAVIVDREDLRGPETVVRNFGAYPGTKTPFDEMARSGAGGFLLERYEGSLEPHTPWSAVPREATMLFRGQLDAAEAQEALEQAGYGWLAIADNGVIPRVFTGLEVDVVHAYHLVPKGIGKGIGVREHLRLEKQEPRHAAAVGDSASDLEMAAEVAEMFIVANGRAASAGAAEDLGNVTFTESANGDGFSEAVDALLGGQKA